MRYGPSSKPFLSSVASAVLAGLLLSGCVTGKPAADQLVDGVVPAEIAETDVPVVASGPDAPASPAQAGTPPAGAPTLASAAAPPPAQPGAIVMQGTGLQATSSSIFSTGGVVGASPVAGGGSSPASLFRSAPQATALPLEATDAGYQVQGAAELPAGAAPLKIASVAPPKSAEQPGDQAGPSEQSLSLIGLFAASRKGRSGKTAAGKPGKDPKAPDTAGMAPQQIAALSYSALPGIHARSMFATVDDTAENHDDSSAAVQVASLSGLARLAPSGLLLQTETVETGCFKPQLLRILKSVEQHFGKKVLVTSGRRSLSHNVRVGGRPQSRHLTCEAADIQVAGISKWDVADFLRQAEGRGGVGTYCHTQSVHIDIGPRRDWNWQCGPRDA